MILLNMVVFQGKNGLFLVDLQPKNTIFLAIFQGKTVSNRAQQQPSLEGCHSKALKGVESCKRYRAANGPRQSRICSNFAP